ncbi:regulator of G-protein signaling 8-like [Trichomycterus rosablanca]|uniref:regulator of G-protein signaling 8-like n=1 Tax=Trichomycterus rosablanca TaxID=2290929 RepID=UPI002F3588D1
MDFNRLQYDWVGRLSFQDTLQWSQSLNQLLKSKYGLATFRIFLKSEFSDENIEFWLTCEDYKKISSCLRMYFKARIVYNQFIKPGSPKEINIDYHTREKIRSNIRSPTSHSFDEAQKIVYGLMERDSYPRFLRSEMYRNLLDSLAVDVANI